MGLIFKLGLRNLLKQKRRNFFLGIGIGFGMMILVIANSFSHGIVDVLINDIASYAYGHLVIEGINPHSSMTRVIRDKQRVMDVIEKTVEEEHLIDVNENLGILARAIGNGEIDNIYIVGVSPSNPEERAGFFNDFFTLVDGSFDDYFNPEIENPIIISETKARSLNVRVGDIIRVRFTMITGQIQAAKLTVVAIANANNSFMDIVTFLAAERAKELFGYKPWESASIQITLKDPAGTSKYYADLIHQKLQPQIISIKGSIGNEDSQILAFKNETQAQKIIGENISILAGDQDEAYSKDGVMISRQLAQKLNLNVGGHFDFQYETKYRGTYKETFKVDAIYESPTRLNENVVLVNGERIYSIYDRYLPMYSDWSYISKEEPLYQALATEWKLMERSHDGPSLQKKYRDDRRIKTDQSRIDVVTMYEGASQVLQLEGVLNLITVIAVMILFFIILIGVINTLRMTVKERTREIGTVRAIGMQKKDVRNVFLIETLLLTAISCIAGIVGGVIVMQLLGSISFTANDALSMILKDGHLNFKINPAGLLTNFVLIMLIAGITAYFPARRAANLSAVEALRHYE